MAEKPQLDRLQKLTAGMTLHTVRESGGKFLFTNLTP
jgi:hypothetical protein